MKKYFFHTHTHSLRPLLMRDQISPSLSTVFIIIIITSRHLSLWTKSLSLSQTWRRLLDYSMKSNGERGGGGGGRNQLLYMVTFTLGKTRKNGGGDLAKFNLRSYKPSSLVEVVATLISRSQSYQTFFFGNKEFFLFSLLSLAVVQYTIFFICYRLSSLTPKIGKPEKSKFGRIDSRSQSEKTNIMFW